MVVFMLDWLWQYNIQFLWYVLCSRGMLYGLWYVVYACRGIFVIVTHSPTGNGSAKDEGIDLALEPIGKKEMGGGAAGNGEVVGDGKEEDKEEEPPMVGSLEVVSF